MGTSRGAITTLTRAAVALAMLAVAVRVLVPAGYMPGRAGEAAIVLCTGQGLQTVYLEKDAKGGPVAPADSHSGKGDTHHPCAFASAAHIFSPHDLAPVVPSVWTADAPDLRVPAVVAPGRGLAAPPPPATGPPLSI
ncbi:hypothetical protein [Phenylobacterium sp.]|uniref:hypothetical protein n=1 Tax=Phenylobacterium sp. TaxID=1871053 RepID=UPI0035B4F436